MWKYRHGFLFSKKYVNIKNWGTESLIIATNARIYPLKRYNLYIRQPTNIFRFSFCLHYDISISRINKQSECEWQDVSSAYPLRRVSEGLLWLTVSFVFFFFLPAVLFLFLKWLLKLSFVPPASVSYVPQGILCSKIRFSFMTEKPLKTMSLYTSAGSHPPTWLMLESYFY